MRTSPDGIALLKGFEGCRYVAYQDLAGVWTIGFGHTEDVQSGMTITQAEAEAFLADDLTSSESYVDLYVQVPLTQHQFDALVSFTYNLGAGTFRRSDLLSFLNASQYDAAADAFLEYDHSGGVEVGGLTRRRQAERALFLMPDQAAGWLSKLKKWMIG